MKAHTFIKNFLQFKTFFLFIELKKCSKIMLVVFSALAGALHDDTLD